MEVKSNEQILSNIALDLKYYCVLSIKYIWNMIYEIYLLEELLEEQSGCLYSLCVKDYLNMLPMVISPFLSQIDNILIKVSELFKRQS